MQFWLENADKFICAYMMQVIWLQKHEIVYYIHIQCSNITIIYVEWLIKRFVDMNTFWIVYFLQITKLLISIKIKTNAIYRANVFFSCNSSIMDIGSFYICIWFDYERTKNMLRWCKHLRCKFTILINAMNSIHPKCIPVLQQWGFSGKK